MFKNMFKNFVKRTGVLIESVLQRLSSINRTSENSDYFFKMNYYVFCHKRHALIVMLSERNKRKTIKLPLSTLVKNKAFLEELSPVDTCILGQLANFEQHGMIDLIISHRQQLLKLSSACHGKKMPPLLQVKSKALVSDDETLLTLYSDMLDEHLTLRASDIADNQHLLYAIGSYQALLVGYDVSDDYIEYAASDVNRQLSC